MMGAEAIKELLKRVEVDTLSTEQPGVTVLDTDSPKGQYTEYWHTDSTFLAAPPLGAVLRAVKLPSLMRFCNWRMSASSSAKACGDASAPTASAREPSRARRVGSMANP